MTNLSIEECFFEALTTYSKTLSIYGASPLDKLMLTALSHQDIQLKFLEHLKDNQFFLNANARISDLPGFTRLIFNFAYLPPKLSFLSISFSAVVENSTGDIKDIKDPYHIIIEQNSSGLSEYTIGSINRMRM